MRGVGLAAFLKIQKDGRQELAYFTFAPRLPDLTDEDQVRWALGDYDHRRYELFAVARQAATETIHDLLCHTPPDDPQLAVFVRAAGDLGLNELIPCLDKQRDNPNPEVQLAVVRALGQVASLDHVPWLASFAQHPHPEFRRQAALALGKIPHPSVPPLLDAFAAADPALGPEVAFGQEKIACFVDHPSEASIHQLIRLDLASDEYEDLAPKGLYVAKALTTVIEDAAAPTALKVRAVRVLGLARLPPLWRTYFAILGQKEAAPEELRYEAIVAIGLLRMRGADDLLLEQLQGPEPRLQLAAIIALGKIGKASTLEPLLDAWDIQAGAFRPAVVDAVRAIAKLDGAPLLESALEAHQPAPTDALFFADETSLQRGLRLDVVEAALNSPILEARRDAALIYAFFGEPARAAPLEDLANRETDPALKMTAALGFARLERLARAQRGP